MCDIQLCFIYLLQYMVKSKQLCGACNFVLLFCYCKQCIMALPQFDSLKQLSASHECYHSDGYFPEQDFNFKFFTKSCGNVDWVCLAHDRNSEHGAAFSHYILQKKSSLPRSSFCVSYFVSCSEENLYTQSNKNPSA